MGLSHYSSEIWFANGVTYLAIERFDREVINDTVQLIHQEDLAQVMSLDWRDTDVKFQSRCDLRIPLELRPEASQARSALFLEVIKL